MIDIDGDINYVDRKK